MLRLGAAAFAGALAANRRGWGAADAFPKRMLNGATAAHEVEPGQFLSARQTRDWFEELDGRRLRASGSKSHEQYLDVLMHRMHRMGLSEIHTETVSLDRWTADSWSLDLLEGEDAGSVPTSGYIPYSGHLPAEGLSAPLAFVPAGTTPLPGSLAGSIALIEIPLPHATLGPLAFLASSVYDPAKRVTDQADYTRVRKTDVDRILGVVRAAGPAAVVAILPLDGAAAAGMYLPFDGVVRDAPGVYVALAAGARLKEAAKAGLKARVKLSAASDHFVSRNLFGLIPGRSSEVIVLNCHTDGPNAIEDNGCDTILAMAQYLSRIPRNLLPRSVQLVLTTGHFAGGAGMRTFISRRQAGPATTTAATLTIEHVGAKQWSIDARGAFVPSNLPEPAIIFHAPGAGDNALAGLALDAVSAAHMDPTLIAGPVKPHPAGTDLAWPGEGQLLWSGAGLCAANYISGPAYLFNADLPTIDCVDFTRLRDAAIGFTNLTLALARTPLEQLRVLAPR